MTRWISSWKAMILRFSNPLLNMSTRLLTRLEWTLQCKLLPLSHQWSIAVRRCTRDTSHQRSIAVRQCTRDTSHQRSTAVRQCTRDTSHQRSIAVRQCTRDTQQRVLLTCNSTIRYDWMILCAVKNWRVASSRPHGAVTENELKISQWAW